MRLQMPSFICAYGFDGCDNELCGPVQVMAATVLSYLEDNGYLEPPQSGIAVECPA